ncbi:MAG TPA: nuclear transport factor 2 family protein [Leptolyngbyaceae cyanobacterium]
MSVDPLPVAKAAFQAFSQGLQAGEWHTFLDCLTEDFTFWVPAGPLKGEHVGKEAAADFFKRVNQVFAGGLHIEIQRITQGGNTVVFECQSHGQMFGHPYENLAAIAFDVREQRICAYREYLGVAYHLSQ